MRRGTRAYKDKQPPSYNQAYTGTIGLLIRGPRGGYTSESLPESRQPAIRGMRSSRLRDSGVLYVKNAIHHRHFTTPVSLSGLLPRSPGEDVYLLVQAPGRLRRQATAGATYIWLPTPRLDAEKTWGANT